MWIWVSVDWQRPICWLRYDSDEFVMRILMIFLMTQVTIGGYRFCNRTTRGEISPQIFFPFIFSSWHWYKTGKKNNKNKTNKKKRSAVLRCELLNYASWFGKESDYRVESLMIVQLNPGGLGWFWGHTTYFVIFVFTLDSSTRLQFLQLLVNTNLIFLPVMQTPLYLALEFFPCMALNWTMKGRAVFVWISLTKATVTLQATVFNSDLF